MNRTKYVKFLNHVGDFLTKFFVFFERSFRLGLGKAQKAFFFSLKIDQNWFFQLKKDYKDFFINLVKLMAKTVEALVDAGEATPGPPLGPALGPLGVNIKQVLDEINKKTQDFKGMKVPIKIEVDDKRDFVITVGVPPTSSLLLSEAGVEKGSGTPKTENVGNVTFKQVVKIAQMKNNSMLAINLRSAVKEVIGTCVSIGLLVDNEDPREIFGAIKAGKYNNFFE